MWARRSSTPARADGEIVDGELVFHIRRLPGGLISSQLGATIQPGHRVQVRGPYGQAFLREGSGPLVLVAGGTGWAPIWSLARTARAEQRHRDLIVIAGSRDRENLYMRPALDWLAVDGVRDVIATVEVDPVRPFLPGRPTLYLPSLGLEDTVYVAGPPGLVDAVRRKTRRAAARCYADPFVASAQGLSVVDRVMQMLRGPASDAVTPAEHAVSTIAGSRLGRMLRPFNGDRTAAPVTASSPARNAASHRS